MNVFHLAAAVGLLGFVGGIALVNIVPTPRAAQLGTVMAGCGAVMLMLAAFRQLIG